ncbi:hypothetical protein TRIUR3_32968 [Triticum urartu]|uniref:Uncharacterized protein n=1 Tax=Triticum urartu TaxID=4572 RepID=M7ZHE3_TRIUA|nr:hypothetical protein TRIUR3_32968 [Triticum urartu]
MAALDGSDFPKEKKEVSKEDGSNKYDSKILFTPWEKLEVVFSGVPTSWFDACWNRKFTSLLNVIQHCYNKLYVQCVYK